ncbi:sulfite exporter TauE/SafE family protein [Nitrospinota bacterium]
MIFFLEFLLFGLGVGIFGTMVGAGGGFILTPVLLLIFPDRPSEIITATSLSVVALNALSGSFAYSRLGRIDVKTSLAYGLVASPWVVVGVFATSSVGRGPFDILLGLALVALCISLFQEPPPPIDPSSPDGENGPSLVERRIVDRDGRVYHYRFRFRLGMWLSTGVGFLSSFFGIGGGPIYVPLLIRVLRIPVHIATATSQCLLLFTTSLAVLVHFLQNNLHTMADVIIPLAIGVIAGAQAGAVISGKLRSTTLTRIFVVLLALIALRLLYQGFGSLLV